MTSEVEKFEQAKVMAHKLGFVVRKAENPNDLKRYTLVRHGAEADFATIDEVLATLQRVKPAVRQVTVEACVTNDRATDKALEDAMASLVPDA